jgi:hypothetical protein
VLKEATRLHVMDRTERATLTKLMAFSKGAARLPAALHELLGMSNLRLALQRVFEGMIVTHWLPAVRDELKKQLKVLERQCVRLGQPVCEGAGADYAALVEPLNTLQAAGLAPGMDRSVLVLHDLPALRKLVDARAATVLGGDRAWVGSDFDELVCAVLSSEQSVVGSRVGEAMCLMDSIQLRQSWCITLKEGLKRVAACLAAQPTARRSTRFWTGSARRRWQPRTTRSPSRLLSRARRRRRRVRSWAGSGCSGRIC